MGLRVVRVVALTVPAGSPRRRQARIPVKVAVGVAWAVDR